MKKLLKKYISVLLAVIFVFTALAVLPLNAEAAVEYSGLNDIQVYFTRLIGSLARADYYNTDVLASVTLSQAVYESGWARYSLPVGGKNLFGIKAYNTWGGKVFDPNEATVYASYDEFLLAKGQSYINTVSAWRAHDSWRESVASHSSLFTGSSNYKAVVGEKDYAKAARAIVAGGYCSDNGYAETVIKLIQQYKYTEYDDLTPDDDGIVAFIADKEQVWLNSGDIYEVGTITFPEEIEPSEVAWKSENESVATVDENGVVTAVSQGMTLVSATLKNGREACCIIYVDCNATVIDSDIYVRVSPSSTADNNGKFYRGTPVFVTEDKVYTDGSGNDYYAVRGYNSKGALVTGYALAEYIYVNLHDVNAISVLKDDITLAVGDEYKVVTAVAPADAIDVSLLWSSSAPDVASVGSEGVITAVSKGEAVITAESVNGVKKEIKVTVADSQNDYYAIVSSYETITVRTEPSLSASSVGRIPFLNQVRVIGEPVGLFYKVTGLNTSGRSITGYVHSAYLRFIGAKTPVSSATAGSDIKVYSEKSDTSYSYGTLIAGSNCRIIGESEDGWSYVIGIKSSSSIKAIYGYARMDGSVPTPVIPTDPNAESYYGETNSTLRVRSGPGTEHETVGILNENTRVVITGDEVNGWYLITASDADGNTLNGYSSSEYITVLYVGETTSNLNVRSGPGVSYSTLGQYKKGTELLLFGKPEDGWYKVECFDTSCSVTSGYCSSQYIKVKGYYTAETPVGGFGINDPSLNISGGYLTGVPADTKVYELLNKFSLSVTVSDASGAALAQNDTVGTGCVLTNPSGETLTVIVKGDATGDGVIASDDYVMIKRCFMGTYDLTGAYLKAAVVSGLDELTVADYVMIKRVVLGSYKLQ